MVEALSVLVKNEEGEVEIEKTPEDYRSRWWSVLCETTGMIGLQMISNFLLLVPVFVTTHKVAEKHVALRDNIGTYEEEDKAYNLLTWLSWHLPVFVVASALLDLLFAVVYLKWLHPWKIILQEEPEKWGSESEEGLLTKEEIEDGLEMELLLNSNQER